MNWSVGRLVCRSVGWLVRWTVGRAGSSTSMLLQSEYLFFFTDLESTLDFTLDLLGYEKKDKYKVRETKSHRPPMMQSLVAPWLESSEGMAEKVIFRFALFCKINKELPISNMSSEDLLYLDA